MALTPEDVVNKRFQSTKFREGYDQDEVDDFLDEVVVELRRLNQPVAADPLEALKKLDGYEVTPADNADFMRHQAQLIGTFLVDRDGVVRHAYVECAEGPSTFGEIPSAEEILASARAL